MSLPEDTKKLVSVIHALTNDPDFKREFENSEIIRRGVARVLDFDDSRIVTHFREFNESHKKSIRNRIINDINRAVDTNPGNTWIAFDDDTGEENEL